MRERERERERERDAIDRAPKEKRTETKKESEENEKEKKRFEKKTTTTKQKTNGPTEFDWVSLDLTWVFPCFYMFSLGCVQFYRVLIGFCLVLPDF